MGDDGNFARRWRELSGESDWKGLLYPLDLDLRKYILHYGDLAGTMVYAINDEKISRWYGYSRYAQQDLFTKTGLTKDFAAMYEVTRFIYATADVVGDPTPFVPDAEDPRSTFIGFVAVSTEVGTAKLGRRDILVIWRGTVTGSEYIIDAKFLLTSAASILGNANDPKVHRGWLSYYTSKIACDKTNPSVPCSKYNTSSAREQVHLEITRLMNLYEEDPEISITLCGHSMGSSLATLNAVDLANGYKDLTSLPRKNCLVSCFLFASPHVGDLGFKNVFDGLKNLHILRISNHDDPATNYPNIGDYTHVGQELKINAALSQYLKMENYKVHELEIYLHAVAGTQGPDDGDGFDLDGRRDIALVNKKLDGLLDKYLYPIEWWVRKNKGMVQEGDSTWEFVEDHELPY